jgi:tetratricopeptide (TPR) repeat protein
VNNAVEKYRVVAHSYSIRGEARQAMVMYRKIIDLSPMDMDVRNKLIEQSIAQGQVGDAINEYLNLADAYYNQADLISARKTYAQAMRLAQQTNADRKWKVNILYRMADIDLQSLDWRQALRVFEQIRNLEPDDEKARTSLIDLNFRLGQSTQALAELDNYAAFLWNNGQKESAIKFLEKMVTEYPKQAPIRRRLAELYRQTGRIPDAIKQLDAAGDMLIEAGDKAGAIEAVMAILALNPPNAADYQRVLARLRQK